MKRWQDRGEVQDSDDEEDSLEASPQRPGKRVRLGDENSETSEQLPKTEHGRNGELEDDGVEIEKQVEDVEHEDEDEDWLRPSPAITYGKKPVRPAAPRVVAAVGLRKQSSSDAASEDEGPAQSHTPSRSRANSPKAEPNRASSQPDAQRLDTNGSSSQPSNDSDDLPDVHDLLARRTAGQGVRPRPLSLPSSPLSERDVSPSPPPLSDIFRFSTPPAAPGPSARFESPALNGEADNSDLARIPPGLLTFAGPRKRNLRTRNEKQLHPYMFDKAQYLQQCRQRGMRPVRIMEAQQAAETQNDPSSDNEDQSSQIVFGNGSSSPRRSSSPAGQATLRTDIDDHDNATPGARTSANDSDDDLPDLAADLRRPVLDGVQHGSKRRRLFSTGRLYFTKTTHTTHSDHHDGNHDNHSIPPSPPPTSSEQNYRNRTEDATPKFKYPRGFTPKRSLPTPRVSSNVRTSGNDDALATSDEDLPTRRSGLPTSSRKIVAIASSSESSEPEVEEPELDERRLHRERRRIKGVLPASWLKIDFRAQQNPHSPSKLQARRADSSSPERASPQKGVAQRIVSRKFRSPDRHAVIDISDDDDSDAAPQPVRSSSSPPRMRQSRLDFESRPQSTGPPSFVDVDNMEVDWIDPMFAGSLRKGASRPPKKRQPKIVDAFNSAPRRANGFSTQRNSPRHVMGGGNTRNRTTKKSHEPHRQRPKVPRLSIVDAPEEEHVPHFRQPQFVRVAMRQAQKQSDNARESPSHKHVRMATRKDTEDAASVLRAWREGTIQPRQTSSDIEMAGQQHDYEPRIRMPLAKLSSNTRRRSPFELQDKTDNLIVRHVTSTHRPRLQQTRLHPEVLEHRQLSAQDHVRNAEIEATPPKQLTLRQTRPQPSRGPYHGAQLESLESEFDQAHRTAAFERKMHLLTESVARHGKSTNAVQLDRFLYGSTPAPLAEDHAMQVDMGTRNNLEVPGPRQALPHRNRKPFARRIDAESREYRQPSEPLPEIVDVDQLPDSLSSELPGTLQGLGPFGTRYATDFDILPFAVGTYFHQTSFLGSGDFAAALNFAGRDLDNATGRITIHIDGDVLEWGAWTEEVASGLARIPRAVADALAALRSENEEVGDETRALVMSNVDYLLRSVTRYFSRCLAFLDPVDRKSCVQRIHGFIEDIFELLEEGFPPPMSDGIKPRCLQYALVIAQQALELSEHHSVAENIATETRKLLDRAAHRLADAVFPQALADLRNFYDDNRHASRREAGIRDHNVAATSVVILCHVLNDPGVQPSPFWAVVYQQLNVNASALTTVPQFDKAWYEVFTLLPMLEIDATGIAQVGSRLHNARQNWTLIRGLVDRLFRLYYASSLLSGCTVNDYIRATLTRCYRLVTRWGWWRCESLLGIIFDFFARRSLAQLHKEESYGSPRYLEQLQEGPSLEVQADDRSFHIFLKLLASSLIGMRQHSVYTEKKVGSIAWRFIPNHGRTYRKDAEMKQQDLDALRNHHDLLCTLYYVTPSKYRLRVDLLRNLVDHSVSHREACRLGVRAWANLAVFQISTNEDDDRLEPFIQWYREMLKSTITQYRLAKQEVERDVESARAQGEMPVSQHIVNDTIARNQRQIAVTLVDLLAAVKRALRSASSAATARYLLSGSAFWDVLSLYDPSTRRLNGVLDEALSIVQTALQVEDANLQHIESQDASVESQDYGDITALQELASSEPAGKHHGGSITDLLHDPVNQLLSNLFGADVVADDALLTRTVDTWVQLAQRRVRSGAATWSSYINGYTSSSWSQLQNTNHRSKFTPYFLAKMADVGEPDLMDMLGEWLESLVQREGILKYEHILTSKILNKWPFQPLLSNSPFARTAGNIFEISLPDLRERRLQLISNVLTNMRSRLDSFVSLHDTKHCKNEYTTLLRRMMAAMRKRFQESDRSKTSEVADSQMQGSYVAFVQQVISLMQQYTAGICPVDAFFTDSSAFPLPVSDPQYVVGRLKWFAPKLGEAVVRKQLVMVVKSLGERAAAEQQQTYWADQLVRAMSVEGQPPNCDTHNLRHVLMTAVLPIYILEALTTPCLWIMSRPVLYAYGMSIEQLLYEINFLDQKSVQIAVDTVTTFFRSAASVMSNALSPPGGLALAHVQATLSSVFAAAQRCLTVAHHLCKMHTENKGLRELLDLFKDYAAAVKAALTPEDSDPRFSTPPNETFTTTLSCRWQDTLDFARLHLARKLGEEWYSENGKYYVRRRGTADEVMVPLDGEERTGLFSTIRSFCKSYKTIFHGGGERRDAALDVIV